MASIRRINRVYAEKVGNWSGAISFMASLGYNVKAETLKAQWDICQKLKSIVVRHLLAQDLPWKELSKNTIKRKKNHKNDILIDTEKYLENIKVWREAGIARVGVKKGITYRRKSGNISLDRLAALLEEGTTKMPARPLWGPSINELGGKEGIRRFVVNALYQKLKKESRGTPIQVTRKDILRKVTRK